MDAVYLFCFTRAGALPPSISARSEEHPLFLQTFMDIGAVARLVELEDFYGPVAESLMSDLSWVGPRVCRHEKVIEQVMDHSPVLPVRFGTIFSSLESLEKRLYQHHHKISSFLDEVTDKEEWMVKGLLNRKKACGEIRKRLVHAEQEVLNSLTQEIRYLYEQRIFREAEKELSGLLLKVYRKIAAEMNIYAEGFRERRILSGDITGEEREMLLNWAFLLSREKREAFRATITRANEEYGKNGLEFLLSGPWPPYSFCPSLDAESS